MLNHWVYDSSFRDMPSVSQFEVACFKHCPLGSEAPCSSPLRKAPCCEAACPQPANGTAVCEWSAAAGTSVCGVRCDADFVLQSGECVRTDAGARGVDLGLARMHLIASCTHTRSAGFCNAGGCPDGWTPAVGTIYQSWPAPGSRECIEYAGCQWAGMFSRISPGPCEGPCESVDGWTAEQLDGGHGEVCCRWPREAVRAWSIAATRDVDPLLQGEQLEVMVEGQPSKTTVVNVKDVCADSDCDGCCSANTGGGRYPLIDLEAWPASSLLGFDATASLEGVELPNSYGKRPGAPEGGVMPLCYRVL